MRKAWSPQVVNWSGIVGWLNIFTLRKAKSKLEQAMGYVKAAQSELTARKAESEHKLREADAKIESADAVYRKSQADVESTKKELADIQNKQSRAAIAADLPDVIEQAP